MSASVLFPGALPPRAENLSAGFAAAGITAKAVTPDPDAHWRLRLEHPQWGSADAICPREPVLPGEELVAPCLNLSETEKSAIAGAGSCVSLRASGQRDNILEDRKRLLRFCAAVSGTDGVAVADHLSMWFWSPTALREELSHDAALDIEQLFQLHLVHEDGNREDVTWLHSHGLAELGYFDFDILKPSPGLLWRGSVLFRAIAFGIVEGTLSRSMDRAEVMKPGGIFRFVEAKDFMKNAAAEDRALRDDRDHSDNRSVLCEPTSGLRNLLRATSPRPSKFLSKADPEQAVAFFSKEASALIGERARATYPMLRQLAEEFAELGLPVLAKAGYEVDGSPDDREYLWFSVDKCNDDSFEGTLENQPFQIAAMQQGDRGTHRLDRLNEWMIMTPVGNISPNSMLPARAIRENFDRIRALLAQSGNN